MSENFDFSLNLESVKYLPIDKYEKDFCFVVNNKEHWTSRLVADLLSPEIRKLHYSDPSLSAFIIDTKQIDNNYSGEDHFDEFLSLSTFQKMKIDKNLQKSFQFYFHALGNTDEYFHLQPEYMKTLSVDNVIERIQSLRSIFCDLKSPIINEVIEYASIHFEEIDKEQMKSLPNDLIEMIVKNERLALNSEDSLFEFIESEYEKDQSNSNLFEYVLFSNIGEENLEIFVNNFDVECINRSIFQSICKRFFKEKNESELKQTEARYNRNKNKENENESNIKEFKPDNEINFNGIMHYLADKTGGNIHDNGTIEITSNSIFCQDNQYHPKNLVDYQGGSLEYLSNDDGGAFVCFNFKEKSFQAAGYSIKSRNTNRNDVQLKNWVIEVSNDGTNWLEIDRHENDPTMNGKEKSYFNINNSESKFYHYLKVRQTGNSWWYRNNHNHIGFSLFEIYGKLREP